MNFYGSYQNAVWGDWFSIDIGQYNLPKPTSVGRYPPVGWHVADGALIANVLDAGFEGVGDSFSKTIKSDGNTYIMNLNLSAKETSDKTTPTDILLTPLNG